MNPIRILTETTENEFGTSSSLQSVLRLLTRHGLQQIKPRPHQSKADFEAQQQFRDTFCKAASNILPDRLAAEQVWISFQDESRAEQRSVLNPASRQEEYPAADGVRSALWKLLPVQFHLPRH